MRVAVVTLFPAMFEALTEHGISSRAVQQRLVTVSAINPRDFAGNKTGRVDDRPYGGGPGMVMAVPPLRRALLAAQQKVAQAEVRGSAGSVAAVNARDSDERKVDGREVDERKVKDERTEKPLTIYLSPQGEPLTQKRVEMLAGLESIVLLCGRYEGVDERVLQRDVDLELSLGDYVLSGGELAAMVLLDALIRLQPGALGDEDSAGQDSFAGAGLLDCPHYTRPEEFDGQRVPEVLLSGDHEAIASWRLEQSLLRTMKRRPDLIAQLAPGLGQRETAMLERLRASGADVNGAKQKSTLKTQQVNLAPPTPAHLEEPDSGATQ
ncbi:MAG: tRNA (guanosine(37)-N1)-methyltransferase TrmD [Pseudomonadales bacterium]